MSHLPLGIRVTPVFYAASTGKTIAHRAGLATVTLGRHAPDGSHIAALLHHGGTRLDWTYEQDIAFRSRRSLEGHQIRRMGPALLGDAGALARTTARSGTMTRRPATAHCTDRPAHRRDQGGACSAAGDRRMRRSTICASEYRDQRLLVSGLARHRGAKVLGAALQSRRGAGERFLDRDRRPQGPGLRSVADARHRAAAPSRGAALDAMARRHGLERPSGTASIIAPTSPARATGTSRNSAASASGSMTRPSTPCIVSLFDLDQARENLAHACFARRRRRAICPAS